MLFSQRLKKGKTTMVPTAIQSTWLNVDGLRIHCLAAGESGSAVLLLHGGGLDSAALSWEEVIGPLSEKHRVFAPDLPGYGQSDKTAIQYTVDYYIAFLEHLMDTLHLEQTSLVGLSMGGGIALGVTLRFPARVEKLVLVDSYGIQGPTLRKTPRSRKVDKCGTVFEKNSGLRDDSLSKRNALRHIERKAPIRVHMLIKERGQSTPVFLLHGLFPFLLG
jgi:hypothetical protein